MKRIAFILSAVSLNILLLSAQPKKGSPQGSDIDRKVDALIAKMTLEEKVGQMTEVTSDVVSTNPNGLHQIDAAKIKEAILKYHVGSILNVSGQAYTREHWYEVVSAIQAEAA
jgi:beta-glucosidase